MASEARKRVSRSLSGDLDSDGDFVDEGGAGTNEDPSSHPGKPGRKKNPNSQAARRDQNRIAQREFRLRKQQRIRDLEARVEILSGSKDETYGQMRDIINELISENQTLRNMVRGLSGFIGEGAGGLLPRMGWSLKEFEIFLSKADTDTAFEAFAKRKRAMQESGMLSSSASNTPVDNNKRTSVSDDTNASRKRARTAGGASFDTDVNFSSSGAGGGSGGSGHVFGQSFSADAPPMELYSSMRPPAGFPSGFLSGLGAESPSQASSSFMGGAGSYGTGGTTSGTTTNGRDAFPAPFPAGGPNAGSPSGSTPLQNISFLSAGRTGTPSGAAPTAEPTPTTIDDDVLDDPKAQEARKLVGYHLENYRRNSAYCLPPSLRPTLVQRTVEHEGIIDGIPHPELRNRMILLRGRFNLADCIHNYLTSTVIHGDDVLAHANWEIQEGWLKKYGYLVDPTTLSLTNRWRKERGEPEIAMTDIAPSEALPGLAQS